MKFCLLVDDKPLFYSDKIEDLEHYINVLYDNRTDGKRASERDYKIISGFNEKQPRDRTHWENVYKTCNRCKKILCVEHFITEKGKEVGSCNACRFKRKTHSNDISPMVKEPIRKILTNRFGHNIAEEIKKKPNISFGGTRSNYIRSPENEIKQLENLTKRPRDAIIIPKFESLKSKESTPLFYEPFKKEISDATNEEVNGIKRWSFYYMYPSSQPKITSSAFSMNDYPTGVKKIGKDDEWVNFSLVCYTKNEKEAKELVEKFMKKHNWDLKKAEEGLNNKNTQWEFL